MPMFTRVLLPSHQSFDDVVHSRVVRIDARRQRLIELMPEPCALAFRVLPRFDDHALPRGLRGDMRPATISRIAEYPLAFHAGADSSTPRASASTSSAQPPRHHRIEPPLDARPTGAAQDRQQDSGPGSPVRATWCDASSLSRSPASRAVSTDRMSCVRPRCDTRPDRAARHHRRRSSVLDRRKYVSRAPHGARCRRSGASNSGSVSARR